MHCFPELCAGQLFPAERFLAWSVRDQAIEPRNGLLQAGTMTGRNPPQDQCCLDRREPFLAANEELPVQCLPDKTFERLDAFPYRQVRQDGWIIVDAHIHRVSGLVMQAPDKAVYFLCQSI